MFGSPVRSERVTTRTRSHVLSSTRVGFAKVFLHCQSSEALYSRHLRAARLGIFRPCTSTSDCRLTRRSNRRLHDIRHSMFQPTLLVSKRSPGWCLWSRSWANAPGLRPESWSTRLRSYGRTHGAWDDERGYVEGSLARLIEGASAWRSPLLPSVKNEPAFLCGLEFDSLFAELVFFARHGLRIDDVEISVPLQPGELLVFDNLAVAHGRRGTRKPGELRQRMFGHSLQAAAQKKLRDDVLAAFYAGATC